VERASSSDQQAAFNTQPKQLSMQEEDLQLTTTPSARGIDVHDRRHQPGLYSKRFSGWTFQLGIGDVTSLDRTTRYPHSHLFSDASAIKRFVFQI
jgi:hypothetical protein